jgi:hypothetical protein
MPWIVLFVVLIIWMSRHQAPRLNASGLGWILTDVEQTWRGFIAVLRGSGPESDHQTLERWEQVALLSLLTLLVVVGRLCQKARLAYRPGPVDIADFHDSTADNSAPCMDTKARFCQILSETQIYPPYAGPLDAPPLSFLDVFEDVDVKPGSLVASAMRAVSRLRPRIGYRVEVVLLFSNERQRPYGITVTVTSFVGVGHTAMSTEWGSSWEDAARKGAYWTLSTILPSTRRVKQEPWRRWREREMPRGLFEAYNEGKRLQDDRRTDEALEQYQQALELDPVNPDLRLIVGSAQEELGLFLEALETYHGALDVGEGDENYDEHLWRRGNLNPKRAVYYWRTWRRLRRRPDLLTLRFRYAITLGYAERTAAQWVSRREGDRERAKNEAKGRLRPVLVDRYWPVAEGFFVPGEAGIANADDAERAARTWVREVLGNSNESAVRLLFQLAAAQELYCLLADRWIAALSPGRHTRVTLTTVRMFRNVWAPLRVRAAWDVWAHTNYGGFHQPPQPRFPFAEHRGSFVRRWGWRARRSAIRVAGSWPAQVSILDKEVGRLHRWWRAGPRLAFMDLYNAACIYSFAMYHYVDGDGARSAGSESADADWEAEQTPSTDLMERAIEYLRDAMASVESDVAARRRTWILANDPDLVPLRYQAAFGRFEMDVYPMQVSGYPRPKRIIGIRSAEYARRLISTAAKAIEEMWQQRTRHSADERDLHQWLQQDRHLGQTLAKVAETSGRHLPNRVNFIAAVRRVVDMPRLARHGFPPQLPTFADVFEEYCVGAKHEALSSDDENRLRDVETVQWLNKATSTRIEEVRTRIHNICCDEIKGDLPTDLTIPAGPAGPAGHRRFRQTCQSRSNWWRAIARDLDDELTEPVGQPHEVTAHQATLW